MAYAVLFYSERNGLDDEGYASMAADMARLVQLQPGYIEHHSFRNPDGQGITISYWETPQDILNWKNIDLHRKAQQDGRDKWYNRYRVEICHIERQYRFDKSSQSH